MNWTLPYTESDHWCTPKPLLSIMTDSGYPSSEIPFTPAFNLEAPGAEQGNSCTQSNGGAAKNEEGRERVWAQGAENPERIVPNMIYSSLMAYSMMVLAVKNFYFSVNIALMKYHLALLF